MEKSTRKPTLLDRFVGCLLGLACGDALGAPVEDWTREMIRTRLGPVRDFQNTLFGRGILTDDTLMAILLCESIIQNEYFDPGHFAYLIGEWMRRIDEGKEMARGAGRTVIIAARRLYKGTFWKRSGEFSAGNAPAARVAPLALFLHNKEESKLLEAAEESAIPTHIDPLAIAGTQVFAAAIRRLLNTDYENFDSETFLNGLHELACELNPQVAEALKTTITKLAETYEEGFSFIVPGKAGAVSMEQSDDLEAETKAIEAIGTGKFILQTLPAAFSCFLLHPFDLEKTIICAVNSGGDTDTIASMAGALAGAFNGAQAIPTRWINELEKKDYLIDLANMLYELSTEGKITRAIGGWRVRT